jgi:hypothetical protein
MRHLFSATLRQQFAAVMRHSESRNKNKVAGNLRFGLLDLHLLE